MSQQLTFSEGDSLNLINSIGKLLLTLAGAGGTDLYPLQNGELPASRSGEDFTH